MEKRLFFRNLRYLRQLRTSIHPLKPSLGVACSATFRVIPPILLLYGHT
jgi:hypothetical protein